MVKMERRRAGTISPLLKKAESGIQGFDEVTRGGLPKGRPTLVVGGPGSGKTLFAVEFIVNGIRKFGEPGVFVSFEESEKELIENSSSLGFDLQDLIDRKKLVLDHVLIEPDKIVETGEYDLEGLFIRINHAIDSVKAKRIALDTLETIFSSFGHVGVIRSEMARLFRFLKDKGVTAVVTAEAGERTLSRHGLEEYISDMVISLDHRITNETATRRMRVVKYRGSSHGTNEYPFLIEHGGLSVLPITSVGLMGKASNKRISTGIPGLDAMMGGKGYFMGSTVLVSGEAGTGKTSLTAEFARRCCLDGKRVLYFLFEESGTQVVRNMRSIGIDFEPFIQKGQLLLQAERPSSFGLEMHLARFHSMVVKFKPDAVVFDPVSSLNIIGSGLDIKSTLLRTSDFLKMRGITVMLTELREGEPMGGGQGVSSLADTWIVLEGVESSGEKNRLLRIVKSRGMAHSNQLREMVLTDDGIKIASPHISPDGVFTGTARYVQERKEEEEAFARAGEVERLKKELKLLRHKTRMQMEATEMEMAERESALRVKLADEEKRISNGAGTHKGISSRRAGMGGSRSAK